MGRLLCIFLLSLSSLHAVAADDERAIKEMTRQTGISIENIRANYKTGCESGHDLPMQICAEYQFIVADLNLNDTYKQLMMQIASKTAKEKLAKAQRTWIAFRDLTCDFQNEENKGGSLAAVLFSSCKEALTETRITQLKEYLRCAEQGCGM